MQIKTLTISNFKGCREAVIKFADGVTRIYGANGTGKTTLFDAFYWMLWGKDSLDRTQSGTVSFYPFDPEKQGEILHNVIVSVEAEIEIDDAFGALHGVTLRRVMKEKWTTPKGTETPRFTGNETEFYIDGLQVQAKQFDTWVKENFDPEVFKLTSNPKYFPLLPWQKQRELLMQLAGEISVDDVIAAEPSVEALKPELENRKPEELKKLWSQQQKAATKDLDKVQLLINENRKQLVTVDNEDKVKADLETQRLLAMKPLDEARQAKADILSGTAVAKKEAEAKALEAKLEVIRTERRAEIAEIRKPFDEKIAALEAEAKAAAETVRPYRQQVVNADNNIRELEKKLEGLQVIWEGIDNEIFDDTTCPCCHRPYEPEQVERMLAEFNESKAKRLAEVDALGQQTADALAEAKKQRDEAMAEVQRLSKLDLEMPDKRAELMKKREEAVQKLPPYENKPEWFAASEDLKTIKRDIEELKIDVKLKLQDAEKAIEEAEKPVRDIDNRLAQINAQAATRERIAGYESQQKNLRLQQDDLSYKLALIKKFDEAKAVITTQRVKAILPGMDFRLFNYNSTNEGYSETCELVKDGKPYANLSNGEKIAVGCELIAAISKHYGVSNPVWIDNAEATTKHLETSGQTILLRVSAADETLRIEGSN